MDKFKYPRTYHLPWSEGATSDDKILKNIDHFIDKEVVVTEKMDGENTTIYSNGSTHARSIDSNNHQSRDYIKSIAYKLASIGMDIRLCGENLYAQHSIEYTELPDYFLVFSMWQLEHCFSWDFTKEICLDLGFRTVPVLYKGIFNKDIIKELYTGVSKCGGIQEGYVVRLAGGFYLKDFDKSVAKFVRANHVQTDEHWMNKKIVVNGLAI